MKKTKRGEKLERIPLRHGIEIVKRINSGKSIEAKTLFDSLIENKRDTDHIKWWGSHSEEEDELESKVIDFEEYFTDMSLKDYTKELTTFESKDGITMEEDLSEVFELDFAKWRFKIVEDLGPAGAECKGLEKIIWVTRKEKKDRITILHEMIHGYEYMLLEAGEPFQQYVTLRLLEKLFPKIPDLMEKIKFDFHLLRRVHSPLFMLKSLDLDLRLKKPLGTIYSYGREGLYKDGGKETRKNKDRRLRELQKMINDAKKKGRRGGTNNQKILEKSND